jgi:hypothetical protein
LSIAALREELLRELAATALGGPVTGAGSDLLNWMSGPADVLRRNWVLNDKGPRMIRAHVTHGSRLWFAPGVYPHFWLAPKPVVVTDTVYRPDDTAGITRICVDTGLGDDRLFALFAAAGSVASFLENVLAGHVQDA